MRREANSPIFIWTWMQPAIPSWEMIDPGKNVEPIARPRFDFAFDLLASEQPARLLKATIPQALNRPLKPPQPGEARTRTYPEMSVF
jgi:hypothetical protein